jgi:N-acetylmuramoyl-L-alanine amidase
MDLAPITGFGSVSIFHMGDKGAEIARIQTALTKMGFPTPVTSIFDKQTKDATIEFQLKQGLTADGSVGPMTLKKLRII